MKLAALFEPRKRHRSDQGMWGTGDLRAAVIGFAGGVLTTCVGHYWFAAFSVAFAVFFGREAYLKKKAGNWPKSKLFWFI